MKTLYCIVCLFFTWTFFGQNKLWTLEEAVAYAVENNLTVKQISLESELADIQKSEALGNMLPTLNGSATFSSNTGTNINPLTNSIENNTFLSLTTGLQSGVTIFSGFQNLRQLQRAKLQQIAAQYNIDKMKDDIALNVVNAYLTVIYSKENLKIIEAQRQVTLQQLERTNALVDAGVLPRGDLLEIKATVAGDEQRLIDAQNQIKIALLNLAQLLAVTDYQNFDISEQDYDVPLQTVIEQPVEAIVSKAKETRPESKVAAQNIELSEKDLQIARGAYSPRLSAFAGYDTRWSDNDFLDRQFVQQLYENDGTFYGVQLQVPIFNGLAARNQVKRAKVNMDRALLQKQQTELEIEANVYRAYSDVIGVYASYQAAIKTEEALQQAYEFTVERFNEGFVNSFDVSQAKVRLENAQSETLRTKYDYIFKLKLLELYFGIPLY